MSGPLIIALPSKGRLKEQTEAWLADCGFEVGERRRLDVLLVANHGLRFGIDVQFRLTAGAGDGDQVRHLVTT